MFTMRGKVTLSWLENTLDGVANYLDTTYDQILRRGITIRLDISSFAVKRYLISLVDTVSAENILTTIDRILLTLSLVGNRVGSDKIKRRIR